MWQINFDTRQYLAPQPPESHVQRPRLEALYKKAINGGFIIVSAPAGYGKTVATAEWVQNSGRAAAWLTVDMYDNDTICFYQALCNAIISAQPENKGMIKALKAPFFQSSPFDHTIRMLSHFKDNGKKYTLILDDLHSITNKRILNSLPLLFRRLPQSFLTVIITRDNCDEIYCQLKKEGAVLIGSKDLSFTEDELAEYFNLAGVEVTAPELEDIHHTTGGWPIGIVSQGVMLNVKGPVTGTGLMERFFSMYLWPSCSEEMKGFILISAITDEMSEELSLRLTGNDNAKEKLNYLYTGNFFVTRRMDGVYTFHRIILDLIRARPEFSVQDFDKCYTLAADFYRERKEYPKAGYYAHQSRNARTIIEHGFPSIYTYLRSFEEMKIFMDSGFQLIVPEDLCEKAPVLYMSNAFISYMAGSADAYFHYLDKMFERWETIADEYPEYSVECYLVAAKDPRRRCIDLCDWAAENVLIERFKDVKVRDGVSITMNMPYLHKAGRDYSELVENGDLQRCMQINEPLGRGATTSDIFYRSIEAGLLLEQNRLEKALAAALVNVEKTSVGVIHEFRFSSLMTLASVYEAMGKSDEYNHVMREIDKFINGNYVFLKPNYLALKTNVSLWRGDKDAAKNWLKSNFVHSVQPLKLYEVPLYFTTLRALILLGQFDDAVVFLSRFRILLSGFRRTIDLAQMDVLDSIIKWHRGLPEEAVDLLADVMHRLQPFGFSRPIGTEGAAVSPILKRLLMGKRSSELSLESKYILDVQLHVEKNAKRYRGIACYIRENQLVLTKRQKMILDLSAQGMRHKQIVETTGLTIYTVKWHAKKVYCKLKVHNMKEAIIKAREIGLID